MRQGFPLILCVAIMLSACSRSARSLVVRGDGFLKEGKYEEALLNYRKALQKEPSLADAYHGVGRAFLRQNRLLDAYPALSTAATLAQDREDIQVDLADLCIAIYTRDAAHPRGPYDRLAAVAEQLLAKDKNSFHGLRLAGYRAMVDSQPKEAVSQFRQANQVRPDQPEVVHMLVRALLSSGEVSEAESAARSLMAKDKTFTPIYDTLYRHYRAAGKTEDAEAILKAKADNIPGEGESLVQLAAYYHEIKKPVEILATLQRLTEGKGAFPQGRLLAGDFYRVRGNPAEARRQYEQGMQARPADKLMYQKRLAGLLVEEGRREEASQLVEAILRDHPQDVDTLQVKAAIQLESGRQNLDEAIAGWRAVVEKKPADPIARYSLGLAYVRSGNQREAQANLLEAVKISPGFVAPRVLLADLSVKSGDYIKSLQWADQALAMKPGLPQARVLRAVSLRGLGKGAEARSELEKLVRDAPNYVDAQIQLALLHSGEKRYAEAKAIYEKLYRPGNQDTRALFGLIGLLVAQRQFPQATELLTRELATSPNPTEIRAALAGTAVRAGDYHTAIQHYEQLLLDRPNAAEVCIALGEAYQHAGDAQKAAVALRRAVELAPKNADAHNSLGTALELAGRKEEAAAQYREALAANPDHPLALNNLAYLLAQSGGDLDEALKLARTAVAARPNDPRLTDTLGYVYLKKKWTDGSIQIFRKLVADAPAVPAYRIHFAMALLDRGDKSGAQSQLQAALKSQPQPGDETTIRKMLAELR